MYILGLSTMTESAAVLLKDGLVVAAAEQERFSRKKHDGGFPHLAIQAVLAEAGVEPAALDHIAVYWNPFNLAYRGEYMLATACTQPRLFVEKARRALNIWQGAAGESSGWGSLFSVKKQLESHFGALSARLHYLDHHTCHMASCFYASDFEHAAILIMDGAGEAACTTSAEGKGNLMRKHHEHRLPHSLGHFYSAVTGYLGFQMLDGEYKMMGMSPYGDPAGAAFIREQVLTTPLPGRYRLNTRALDYHRALRGDFQGAFGEHFGPARTGDEEFTDRHRDIAASAQRAYEEVVLDLARDIKVRTGASALAIAGGCGLNCVANGKILSEGIFERLYVPPVPNDSGGALGAAMQLYRTLTGRRPQPVTHAQFGPSYSQVAVLTLLQGSPEVEFVKLTEAELVQRVARTISSGGVVAWHQGRMEYGARALGNRSFLADPRSDAIRDVLNQKIKKRELFRPFAPSVKEESAAVYFELAQPSPFMTVIVPVRQAMRGAIPAVTHIDGTARPQTVSKADNPRYWALLDAFERITGVPVLLNTSFNIQEPIVCSPEQSLATFLESSVDALAMGDYYITRAASQADCAGAG